MELAMLANLLDVANSELVFPDHNVGTTVAESGLYVGPSSTCRCCTHLNPAYSRRGILCWGGKPQGSI
jgi:hypothetical protein